MHINQPNLPCHALFPKSIDRIAFQKMYQFCIEVQGGFVMADNLHMAEGGGNLDE
jgi:hypothetical protein